MEKTEIWRKHEQLYNLLTRGPLKLSQQPGLLIKNVIGRRSKWKKL